MYLLCAYVGDIRGLKYYLKSQIILETTKAQLERLA